MDVELISFPVKVNSAPTDLEGLSPGVNFTSVPSVTLNLEVSPVFDVSACLAMLLPRVYTRYTVVTSVTSSCTVSGTGDFTYFPGPLLLFLNPACTPYSMANSTPMPISTLSRKETSLTAGVAYTHTIWEYTNPFNNNCFLFGNSKTGLGELRNLTKPDVAESEQVYDLDKIEQQYVKDGKLSVPLGIDVAKLRNQQGLSETLKTALDTKPGSVRQGNGTSDQDVGGGSNQKNVAMVRVFGPTGNGNGNII